MHWVVVALCMLVSDAVNSWAGFGFESDVSVLVSAFGCEFLAPSASYHDKFNVQKLQNVESCGKHCRRRCQDCRSGRNRAASEHYPRFDGDLNLKIFKYLPNLVFCLMIASIHMYRQLLYLTHSNTLFTWGVGQSIHATSSPRLERPRRWTPARATSLQVLHSMRAQRAATFVAR